MSFRLRQYQLDAVAAVEREWQSVKSTLLVMPTGSGKSLTLAEILRRAFPRRGLVLAQRSEIVKQNADKIRAVTGWRVDIEMGELRAELSCLFGGPRVVCSTIQTQASGGDGSGRMTRFDPRMFGVVVIDEGHHGTSASYRKVLDWYTQGNPDIRILGVTATPDRADEEALGQLYETVAMDYEVQDAVRDGWLVPVVQNMVHVEGLDFSHCRTTAGDLNGSDLAEVMEYEDNLQRIVAPSIDIIGDKRTLVFASSVNHAERISEMFNRHRPGMAGWACGETPKPDRERLLSDFACGRVQVAVNCALWTEGWDGPFVEKIVMARPTKSRSLYAQMVGRGMRPVDDIAHELNDHPSSEARRALIEASSKPVVEIVDYVGNSGKHKLMTSVDILGGNVSEHTRDLVTRKLSEGKPMRVDEAIAETLAEEEEKAKIAAAKRAKLLAKASYQKQAVDPFNVFDIKPVPARGWDAGKALTPKQSALLEKQGIDISHMSYGQAKQLLNTLFERWDKGLASFKQCALLRKRGLPTNVTRDEAKSMIDQIAIKEGWAKKK